MKTHLNTLFVTLEDAYLRKDGAAIDIRHEGKSKLRVPLHNLDGVCCFGWNTVATTALMAACAEAGVSLSFHTPHGKFVAAAQAYTSGNIHLRRQQYRIADAESASVQIARKLIVAKLNNCRTVVKRAYRDYGDRCSLRSENLQATAAKLENSIRALDRASNLEEIRGIEGEGAVHYFAAFNHFFTEDSTVFQLNGRSRRPPMDPVNAVLSFCYTLLMHDCRSACESVGLDSQCGFLHRDRPGRPSLALDLMEELRPGLADRASVSIINRKQLTEKDFEFQESGAVLLKEDSRKKVLAAWQERKKEEFNHPVLKEKVSYGLLPFVQALLLARYLRGDLEEYPSFMQK
jgi:CRISPR-associated protein Cas1